MPSHPSETPAKKQSKWSGEEDTIIIDLRGRGMKWEDISKRLPGRSAISCRLHYQNYLERRSEWDEERKNKLARLYERFKPEMWAKVAEELAVPWRAAEAMHWNLGESDMARRAGVVPFALSTDSSISGPPRPPPLNAPGPPRVPGHAHSHSHGGAPLYSGPPPPGYGSPHSPHQQQQIQQRNIHTRSGGGSVHGQVRPIAARRDSTPRSVPPPSSPAESLTLAGIRSPMVGILGGGSGGNGNGNGHVRGGPPGQMLPGVLEMTTRVSPYSTPAYSASAPMSGGAYLSPGPLYPAMGYREGSGVRVLPMVPESQRRHSGSSEDATSSGREGLQRGPGGYE